MGEIKPQGISFCIILINPGGRESQDNMTKFQVTMMFHAHMICSSPLDSQTQQRYLHGCIPQLRDVMMKIDLEKKKQNSAGAAGHVIIIKVPHNRIGHRTLEKIPQTKTLFLETLPSSFSPSPYSYSSLKTPV